MVFADENGYTPLMVLCDATRLDVGQKKTKGKATIKKNNLESTTPIAQKQNVADMMYDISISNCNK